MIDENKSEQAFQLAKTKYPESPYAALWGSAQVFLTEEQIQKIINFMEVK
jgi:hypothetical protein